MSYGRQTLHFHIKSVEGLELNQCTKLHVYWKVSQKLVDPGVNLHTQVRLQIPLKKQKGKKTPGSHPKQVKVVTIKKRVIEIDSDNLEKLEFPFYMLHYKSVKINLQWS